MPAHLVEDQDGLMTVLEEALQLMADADKNADQRNTSWQIRVQCGEAILALIRIDTGVSAASTHNIRNHM